MKKTLISMHIAAGILAMSTAASAAEFMDGKVKISGAAMQAWQSGIEVEGAAVNPNDAAADSAFQRMRFALNINAQVAENVSVFAELAEEPNDWNNGSAAISQDLAWIQFDLPNNTGVRLGNVVSTTQNFIRYSDGAAVQSNPFVGNSLIDMITAEEGLWAYGSHTLDSGTNLTWDAVLATPDFFTDFSEGHGYNIGLRGTVNLESGLSFGAGAFKTDHKQSAVTGKPFGSLIAIGDGDNYQFANTAPSARATHPLIVPGVQALVWQADVQYKGDNFLVHAIYGEAKDDYSWAAGEGSLQTAYIAEESKMEFWSVEGKYDISKDYYLAARYAESSNKSTGVNGPNKADRLQLSAGYWMNDSTLFKAEYVKQEEEQFSGGGATIFGAAGGSEWDGFIIEASVTF
ncbi:hypothetical protein KDX31_16365 [Amphritea atlantica]|uniref:Porin n=1 Tax=Amphritea atlantica TaxID=355243 RepID=A0ABY5GSZ8_9GAMM|nr:hypothetical protein KDX31_16365 [Amphritea atlantica]